MKNSILSLIVMLITITVSAQTNYSINGNLGLDTIPEHKLDVNGDAMFYGDVKVDQELYMEALKSTSPIFEQLVYIDEDGRMQRLGGGGARLVVDALSTLPCRDVDENGNPIPGTVYWNFSPEKITAYDQACGSPNVGIGTDNPTARLDVRGNGRFSGQISIGAVNQGNSRLYVRGNPINSNIVIKDYDEEIEIFSVSAKGEVKSANHEINANNTTIPGIKVRKQGGNSGQYGVLTVVDDNATKTFAAYNSNENKDVFAVRGDGRVEIKATEVNQKVLEVKSSDNEETFSLTSNGQIRLRGANYLETPIAVYNDEDDRIFLVKGDGHIWANAVHIRELPDMPFPDYVFEPDYKLMPLNELQKHIKEHKRLPNMPSAETVAKDGMDLGEMNCLLVEKVEELTLYILSMEERMKALENK